MTAARRRFSLRGLRRWTLALAALAPLAACGFQLRGVGEASGLPAPPTVQVSAVGADADLLRTALWRELSRQGPWQKTAVVPATCALRIEAYRETRRPLALAYTTVPSTSNYVRVAGYQITAEVRFSLRVAAGETLMPGLTLQAVRDFTFSEDLDRPAGTGEEEAVLWSEVRAELARDMRWRIAPFAESCLPVDADADTTRCATSPEASCPAVEARKDALR